jgi:hypothetical protein
MLTGQRVFAGEDVSDTPANVLKGEPAWERLPAEVPTRIRQVLRGCLQKDLKQRIHDVADVRLALGGAFEKAAPQTTTSNAPAAPGRRLAWAVASEPSSVWPHSPSPRCGICARRHPPSRPWCASPTTRRTA